MLGDGAEKRALKARAQALGLNSVVFVDSVPKRDVPRYWSLLDVSLIHLRDTPLFAKVIPSKLFECMAMGIPVAHGVRGESARIVETEDVGLLFEPEDVDGLAATVLALASAPEDRARMSRNGIAAARRYDRNTLAASMLAVLTGLVRARRAGRSPGSAGVDDDLVLQRVAVDVEERAVVHQQQQNVGPVQRPFEVP
jgi:glycosyltransferase involved in cell wall biosynthesis